MIKHWIVKLSKSYLILKSYTHLSTSNQVYKICSFRSREKKPLILYTFNILRFFFFFFLNNFSWQIIH